jgi:hypothetical protein
MATNFKFLEAKEDMTKALIDIPFNPEDEDELINFKTQVQDIMKSRASATNKKAALEALKDVLPTNVTKFLNLHNPKDVDEALKLMTQRYGNESSSVSADHRIEYNRLFQQKGQKIGSFMTDLEELYMKVNPTANLTDDDTKKALLEALETKCLRPYVNEISVMKTVDPTVKLDAVFKQLKEKERQHIGWESMNLSTRPTEDDLRYHQTSSSSSSSSNPSFSINLLNPNGETFRKHRDRLTKSGVDPNARSVASTSTDTRWCWCCGVNDLHGTFTCPEIQTMRQKAKSKQSKGTKYDFYCVGHLQNSSHHTTDCKALENARKKKFKEGKCISIDPPVTILSREREKQEAARFRSEAPGQQQGAQRVSFNHQSTTQPTSHSDVTELVNELKRKRTDPDSSTSKRVYTLTADELKDLLSQVNKQDGSEYIKLNRGKQNPPKSILKTDNPHQGKRKRTKSMDGHKSRGKQVRFLLPLDKYESGNSEPLMGTFYPRPIDRSTSNDLHRRCLTQYWTQVAAESDSASIVLRSPKLISILVNSFETQACCVDSGSAADLVSMKFLRENNIKYRTIGTYQGPKLTAVGGTAVTTSKIVRLTLEMGGVMTHVNFIAVNTLPFDILLGTPFLDSHLAVLDHGLQIFTIMDSAPIPFIKFDPHKLNIAIAALQVNPARQVKLKDTIVLRRRTTTPVKVCVDGKHSIDEQGFITPMKNSVSELHRKILLPHLCLVDLNTKAEAKISIANLLRKDIKLSKGTVIGFYQMLNHDEVNSELIELGENTVFGESEENDDKHDEAVKQDDDIPSCDGDTSCTICAVIASLSTPTTQKESHSEDTQRHTESPSDKYLNTLSEEVREVLTKFEVSNEMDETKKLQLLQLLFEFHDIWLYDHKSKINHLGDVEHEIVTNEGTKPIRCKLRPLTLVEESIIDEHLDLMVKRDVIRPSNSPWAAPILLADKKNGKIRFCVDFRRLNKQTRRDAYPLPNIQRILDKLGGKRYYSTIDLRDAFWQIRVSECDKEKTAFISHRGLYEFNSMPFGLTNAPATQQRWIEKVLLGLNWTICMAYLDDIVVFSDTFENHIKDLRSVFTRLQQRGMTLAPEKCSFCKPSFEILGHVCSSHGIAPNPSKIQTVLNYPRPTNKDEMARFLGVISWVRRFILNCSTHTAPLRELMKMKDKNFTSHDWTKSRIEAFEKLKKILTSAPVLTYPDFTREFYLHVDASQNGLGAVLTQQDDQGRHQVIAYASTALNEAQSRYPATTRECLAILWALKHFRHYVFGREFTIFTDHAALVPTLTETVTSHRMLKDWTARILEFDPKIVHRPGRLMLIPDALSRIHYAAYDTSKEEAHVLVVAPRFEDEIPSICTASCGLRAERYSSIMNMPSDYLERTQTIDIPDIRTFPTDAPMQMEQPHQSCTEFRFPRWVSNEELNIAQFTINLIASSETSEGHNTPNEDDDEQGNLADAP